MTPRKKPLKPAPVPWPYPDPLEREGSLLSLRALARAAEGLEEESRLLYLQAFAQYRARWLRDFLDLRATPSNRRLLGSVSGEFMNLMEQIGCLLEAGDQACAQRIWQETLVFARVQGVDDAWVFSMTDKIRALFKKKRVDPFGHVPWSPKPQRARRLAR